MKKNVPEECEEADVMSPFRIYPWTAFSSTHTFSMQQSILAILSKTQVTFPSILLILPSIVVSIDYHS